VKRRAIIGRDGRASNIFFFKLIFSPTNANEKYKKKTKEIASIIDNLVRNKFILGLVTIHCRKSFITQKQKNSIKTNKFLLIGLFILFLKMT